MNTTELINEIARRSKSTPYPLTRRAVGYVIDELLELVTQELSQEGGEIRLRGIGVLTTTKRRMPNIRSLPNIDLYNDTQHSFLWIQFRASSKLRHLTD